MPPDPKDYLIKNIILKDNLFHLFRLNIYNMHSICTKIRALRSFHPVWLTFFCLMTLPFSGCGEGGGAESGDHPPVTETTAGGGQPADEVWLTPTQESVAGLSFDTARLRSVGDELLLNGLLEVPPQHHARLYAPIPAFVKRVQVKEGERVSEGQVLLRLEHPAFLELQKSFLENEAKLVFLKAENERLEQLYRRQATELRSLEQSRSEYRSAQAQHASLRAQLLRLHTDPSTIDARQLTADFPVKSPFSGFVTAVKAFPGQFTGSTEELVGVLDLSHMHVELDLPESHLPQVQPNMPFRFNLTRLPEQIFDAEVFSIGRELKPEHRTVRIHGHIEREQDPLLRPGMSVIARIPLKASDRVSVSPGALLSADTGWVAFQKVASGRYKRVILKNAAQSNVADELGDAVEVGTVWVVNGAARLEAQWSGAHESEGHH